jgi:copper chaperone CopZ
MNTMLCSVSGIQNKENKTQIKNALNKIEGVNEVGVNLATGTIEISYNQPATENEIKNCIETRI